MIVKLRGSAHNRDLELVENHVAQITHRREVIRIQNLPAKKKEADKNALFGDYRSIWSSTLWQ